MAAPLLAGLAHAVPRTMITNLDIGVDQPFTPDLSREEHRRHSRDHVERLVTLTEHAEWPSRPHRFRASSAFVELASSTPTPARHAPGVCEEKSNQSPQCSVTTCSAAWQRRSDGSKSSGCNSSDSNGACSPLGLVQHHGVYEDLAGSRGLPLVSGSSPGSFCATSDRHKFIFVHILKNGGSFTKAALARFLGADVRESDCQREMRAHPDYLRWAWLRHPAERALSVYAMAKSNYNLPKEVTFDAFWRDDDRWQRTTLHPDHGRTQADFLADANGCLAVDYVANLGTDPVRTIRTLSAVLRSPDRAPFDALAMAFAGGRETSGNVFGATEEHRLNATARELVARQPALDAKLRSVYARDYRMFEFDQLC